MKTNKTCIRLISCVGEGGELKRREEDGGRRGRGRVQGGGGGGRGLEEGEEGKMEAEEA